MSATPSGSPGAQRRHSLAATPTSTKVSSPGAPRTASGRAFSRASPAASAATVRRKSLSGPVSSTALPPRKSPAATTPKSAGVTSPRSPKGKGVEKSASTPTVSSPPASGDRHAAPAATSATASARQSPTRRRSRDPSPYRRQDSPSPEKEPRSSSADGAQGGRTGRSSSVDYFQNEGAGPAHAGAARRASLPVNLLPLSPKARVFTSTRPTDDRSVSPDAAGRRRESPPTEPPQPPPKKTRQPPPEGPSAPFAHELFQVYRLTTPVNLAVGFTKEVPAPNPAADLTVFASARAPDFEECQFWTLLHDEIHNRYSFVLQSSPELCLSCPGPGQKCRLRPTEKAPMPYHPPPARKKGRPPSPPPPPTLRSTPPPEGAPKSPEARDLAASSSRATTPMNTSFGSPGSGQSTPSQEHLHLSDLEHQTDLTKWFYIDPGMNGFYYLRSAAGEPGSTTLVEVSEEGDDLAGSQPEQALHGPTQQFRLEEVDELPTEAQKEEGRRQIFKAKHDGLAAELAGVEERIRAANLLTKSTNMHEKAEALREKTGEVSRQSAQMKKEIDVIRKSDRVMVSLRDTYTNLQKHVRLRVAHVRQKEATIELLDRRCDEQVEGIKGLLATFEAELKALLAETAMRDKQSALANRTDPLRCAAYLIRRDARDEQYIHETAEIVENLEKQHAATAQELMAAKTTTVLTSADTLVAKEVEKRQAFDGWQNERRNLMAQYAQAKVLYDEYHYHITRGTYIKPFGLLNMRSPEHVVEDLRKLMMVLEESQVEIARSKGGLKELKQAEANSKECRVRDLDDAHALLKGAVERRSQLQAQNAQLRERYTVFQRNYVRHISVATGGSATAGGADAGGPPMPLSIKDVLRSTTPKRAASSARYDIGAKSPGYSPGTPQKAFTPDILTRLQKPTRSREEHLNCTTEEHAERHASQARMQMMRPRLKPTFGK